MTPDPTTVPCPACDAWRGWACVGAFYGYHAAGYHPARHESATFVAQLNTRLAAPHPDLVAAQRACPHDGQRTQGGLRGAQIEICMLCGFETAKTDPDLWRAACALADQHERVMGGT